MSFVDHTQAFKVPYSVEDTFDSLKNSISKTNFSIDRADDNLKTLFLKAGVSLASWGENITVSVSAAEEGAEVMVLSTPKTGVLFGGAMDLGKNRKNINEISRVLSIELEKYEKYVPVQNSINNSAADEIGKLADLKEKGIISEMEFEAKKKQLLGL
jgi:hypothetical protein